VKFGAYQLFVVGCNARSESGKPSEIARSEAMAQDQYSRFKAGASILALQRHNNGTYKAQNVAAKIG